ncbi:bifunctional alpha/beta hydrolase/class I SAM-dependent methyltransferase [Sulfurovum sp.]|uniref:bifunctional alpha/beta hydrolase/class I SAM-dependent methyltransferase n=1 Tax=Sulfurovum sp. TaxID=1969726 RepID=UPI00356988A4
MTTQTGYFTSFDNNEIFYRKWVHDAKPNGRILLLLHRGHEHSERLDPIAQKKEFEGYTIYSYDNRGHGNTKVPATYEFMDLVRDLNSFVGFVCQQEEKKEKDIFVVANSVAGVVASTWVHDYAPSIKGMALIAPAFKIKLYAPFAKESLKLAIRLKPQLNIKSYVKAKFLTHDKTEQVKYNQDKLITPNIPARQLTTLLDTAKRVVGDANLIVTPTLVLSATKDYVVDSKIQGDFFSKLSSEHKKFVQLEGFFHGVLYEENNQLAIDEISSFMTECFDKQENCNLDTTIKETADEFAKIAYGSLPLLTEMNYAIQKFMMSRLGSLSDGMKVGLTYGFDSGVTLDYVYKNEASGKTFLGTMIDQNYLNSIGWKGIRQRKINIEKSLEEKIAILHSKGQKVRILDIAGGPARYLIDIASNHPEIEVQVRDYQEQNVQEGRQLAQDRGLTNISYMQCDAFDSNNYDKSTYSPNIIIISGIFELFSDNALIANAIEGVCSIIEENGFLIYTGQPWHPQLEQIANVLGNHQNEKWVMRRRSQYELDKIFKNSGFVKDTMDIDDWGIFTVSSAMYQSKTIKEEDIVSV